MFNKHQAVLQKDGSSLRFIILLLASTFLMASSFIAGKKLMNAGFPPFTLVGCRFLLAALATLPILYFEKGKSLQHAVFPPQSKAGHIRHLFVIGLLQTTGVIGLIFWAMESISANMASILLYTNPLWVALLSVVWLSDRLSKSQVIGLFIGIVGVILAIGIGSSGEVEYSPFGMIIGLCSAFCWSLATILNKKTLVPFSHWTLTFWQMLIGSLFLLLIGLFTGEQSTGVFSIENVGWFLWLAIPGSTVALGLWFKALTISGATKASGYLFLCPAFTILISYLLFGAVISGMQLCGGLLIAIALLLISKESKKKAIPEVV